MRCLIIARLLARKNEKCVSKLLRRNLHTDPTGLSDAKLSDGQLCQDLYLKIKSFGPITVADYMKEALAHPTLGYYMKKDVFGSKGDFTTSPEISQLFGEMIGVWVLSEWRKITRESFQLVELGPGRATLCKQVLKVFQYLKVADKPSIHFVEISPALSKIQAENLCVSSKEVTPVARENEKNSVTHYREGLTEFGSKVFWYHSIEDVPRKFSVFIANEFFDALPIHKYQKSNGKWHEIFVDIDPTAEGKFRYVLSSSPTLTSQLFISDNETRDHVEMSPQTVLIVDYLAKFLDQFGGFGLIIDYGHSGEKKDTFRAFKNHQQQDPLVDPGSADLTADVDFSMIKNIATKDDRTIVFGPADQQEFLLQLGIDVRLKMLLAKASEAEKELLKSQYDMLIDQDKMGKCFKVLSLFPAVLKEHLTRWPVAGFVPKTTLNDSTIDKVK